MCRSKKGNFCKTTDAFKERMLDGVHVDSQLSSEDFFRQMTYFMNWFLSHLINHGVVLGLCLSGKVSESAFF